MVVRLVRLWFSFIILTIPVSSAQISPIYFKNDLSNLNNSNKSYTEIVNTNNSFINGSNAIMFTKKTGFLIIFSLLQLCAMSPPSCNKMMNDLFGILTSKPNKSQKYSFFEVYTNGSPDGTSWDDVIGNNETVNELRRLISLSLSRDTALIARRTGVSVPRNILLIGPPGTGKTLMARAASEEMKVPLLVASASEIVKGKYAGVGVERVKTLFDTARIRAVNNKNRMSMIFIDELDSCGRSRGGDSVVSIDHDNTLNQLLVELDGFKSRDDSEPLVIVLAATNRKDILDSALLRKGRFDNIVHLRKPDLKDRINLFKYYVNKQRINGRSREICVNSGKKNEIIFQALNEEFVDNNQNITTLKVVAPIKLNGKTYKATLFSNKTARVKTKDISSVFGRLRAIKGNNTSDFNYDIKYNGCVENDDMDFIERLADLSDGLVGADISAIVNEAALKAMNEGRIFATEEDYLNVIEDTILGKPIKNIENKADWRIAIHEAGHILASFILENVDFATRASIVPRSGGSLGVTMFGANNIKNLRASELRDRLVMILSGKAAESHVFDGDSSTGASDDLDRATVLAKGIVKNFAMNGIKYTIDGKESKIKVQKELINAETRANNLVKKYNKTLYDIANELMIHETLNTDKLNILLANSDLETKKEPYSPNKVMNNIMNDFRKIRDKNINKDVVKTRGDRRKQAFVLLFILILPNI